MNTHNDPSSQATTTTSSDPAWFKVLVDNSPNGVFALNDRQEIIFFNAKMADILGYPKDEILGRNFQIFLTAESVAFVTEQYHKRQRGEEVPATYECSVRCKNGAEKPVEVSGGVIRDAADRPLTIGTMVDQSWCRETDDRLRRYEQIISSTDDLMAFVDKNYIYQAVNRAYLRSWNKEEESEIVGHSVADLLGAEVFQTTVKDKLDRCLAGESIRYAHWFDFANAGQRFADVSYQPYPDEQGKIVGAIVNSRDITQQYLAQQALEQQKHRAQAYLDIAGVMLGAMDLQGTITLMNKKGHELLGYPEGELLGENWFNTCLPATNREAMAAVFQQQMSGDFTPLYFFENSVLTRAGNERLVAFHNTLLYDGDKLCGVLFSGEDITQRKQAEKELQESEARLDLAMMIKNEGTWDWNLVTNQVDFDQRYYTMAGYDPDDFADNLEEFQQRIHPEDEDCVMSTAEQYLAGQIEQFQVEFRFKRKDGAWMWILGRGQIVERDEKSVPLRFIGTHSDVTDRKLLEQQLRQKYKMEAIGVMAGGIAHNFNNNLSIILGNVELSQLKNNDPEVGELLTNAKIGIMRSRDLVSQIMSYCRKGVQSLAPLQPPLIIDETLKLLSATIPTTVQLHQSISPASYQITINADASQIQEILLNLYGNAVYAMEEKGELAILLDVVDLTNKDISNPDRHQPGRYARITIQDSGCGMTAEVKERIFDPFFTTKEMHEGTGMGLATVQGIMEQHNGLIKVESSVGQGTTFELYFPAIDQAQAAQPIPSKADIPRGSEKILFVDDDEMLANLGELTLTELGYQISTVIESPEALKLFAANADYFDLVITDQTMPDLSGKELIQELLKIRPDLPTIICTGYSSRVSKKEAQKLGAKAFIMKPLDLKELAQMVRRVLDERLINGCAL